MFNQLHYLPLPLPLRFFSMLVGLLILLIVLVQVEALLRRVLKTYADYYNGVRTHLALGKDAPLRRPVQSVGRIVSVSILGGLHHKYVRMA